MATVSKLSTGVRPADIPERQLTTQLGGTLANGAIVKLDTTNGTFVAADGTTAAVPIYVLLEGGIAGEYRTGIQRGKIAGFDVSALAFGARVHAGAGGTLDTAAGTANSNIGTVIPATGNAAQPFDKIIEVG